VLVFNHPYESSYAAVTSPEDVHGNKEHEFLANFDSLSLPDLDEDIMAHMDVMDVQRYQ